MVVGAEGFGGGGSGKKRDGKDADDENLKHGRMTNLADGGFG